MSVCSADTLLRGIKELSCPSQELINPDLSPDTRNPFENAMQKYQAYPEINRYFPQGEMNLARYYEDQGEGGKVMEAYRNVLKRNPYFTRPELI